MASYDDSISPPDWWFELLETAIEDSTLNLKQIAQLANAHDGRADRWDGPNITKLRNRHNMTTQLVLAVSSALSIVPPVFLPADRDEAEAMRTWLAGRRQPASVGSGSRARTHGASQALAAAVNAATDQTGTVPLASEGSPRSPRTRRAPRSRS